MDLLAMLVLSIALWLPGAGNFAQDDLTPLPPPFCGELSEADCQLLTDSQEVMRSVSSMSLTVDLGADVSGIPDIADDELVFDLSMDMTMHLDPALNEALREISLRSPEDLLESREEFGQLVVELYETMAIDMNMSMSLPKLLRDTIEAEEGTVLPATIPIEIRIVDGYLYINMDTLAEAFPELQPELESEGIEGWIGMDLAGQMRQEMLQSGGPPDASALQSMQMGMVFNQLMTDETIRELLSPYITVERLEDETRDGATVAVFSTSLELGELVSRPNFTRLLRQAAESIAAASGEEFDQQELGTGVLGMQLLANVLARSFVFEIVQAIGVETPYVYDYNLYLELDLGGLLTVAAMSGEEIPPELAGAKPVFTFDMNASYSDFDAAPAVEAPEGAQILPLDSMDQDSINVIS